MPILTIEAILENPWNAVTEPLPAAPSRLLLSLACLAARYCRDSEGLLTRAAHAGLYTPPGWLPEDGQPDIHEENEARAWEADFRLTDLENLACQLDEE